ncbi:MAG: NAD-dependent epimerase/dehydratase family protein [Patescibacteria group bacterium]
MNEIKTLLLLGGTGFVGRAVAEEYSKNGWYVIVPTRENNNDRAKEKLLLHGFDKYNLEKLIGDGLILFALDVDLVDKKWSQINNWLELFDKLDISILSILRIINLVGETSKSTREISKSNIDVLNGIFTLVQYLKSRNKQVIFCSMGSTAEKKQDKNLSPYERAKRVARQKIEESNLCDYHFVVNYIKGKGEQKMKSAAPGLWSKLRFSQKWLFGFKVSIIDVDDLAQVIYHISEAVKNFPLRQKPLEVNITNGELLFGEMIKNLLPEDKKVMPRVVIPFWAEKYFLKAYVFIAPRINPHSQLIRRLVDFAKRGSMNFIKQEKLRVFKTAEEIKKLALDTANYLVLEASPYLIVANRHNPVIYVLRERSEEELKQIVQKAAILSD